MAQGCVWCNCYTLRRKSTPKLSVPTIDRGSSDRSRVRTGVHQKSCQGSGVAPGARSWGCYLGEGGSNCPRALPGGCRGVLSLYFHCPAPTASWGLAHDAHTGLFGGLERQWRHPLWRRSTRGSWGCCSCAGCRQLSGVVPRSAVIAGVWVVFDPRHNGSLGHSKGVLFRKPRATILGQPRDRGRP